MKTEERPKILEEVAPLLGHAYIEWKQWEGRKNDYKTDLFRLFDEELERRGFAAKLVHLTAPSDSVAVERVERHYPSWVVDEHRPHRSKPGVWEVLLIENPVFMPHSFVHEGIKYARTVSKGPVMIDDEWLKEEDSELYEAVTYQLPWGQRITVPVEQLDEELIGRLAKYIYNDKPRVSLAKPREVKEDEE